MAPIRRYLRITPYTVLEVRFYLDNPSLSSWLLNPRLNILPKIISSIRPLVLPKLREEAERSRGKKGKRKTVRDTLVEDEFEVSVFLTEGGTRHAVLKKVKTFEEKKEQVGKAVNIDDVTGNSAGNAVDVEGVSLLREESDEMEGLRLDDIPAVQEIKSEEFEEVASQPRRSKRTRAPTEDEEESLFVPQEPEPKRARSTTILSDGEDAVAAEEGGDDKKKLGMKTTYDGYAIYGRVLCLIVKQRGTGHLAASGTKTGGQANMENWIASTQAPVDEDGD